MRQEVEVFGDEWGRWGIKLSGKGMRGEAHKCFEWGVFYCRVSVGVVSEFCEWEKGNPIRLPHIAECLNELLQFLVKMFGLTISLGVVCSTEILINIKEVTEGTGKVSCELCSLI